MNTTSDIFQIENLQHLFASISQYTSQSFFNTFHNKNVAIVGPSKDLLSKNLGPEIDSYDIVVKINYGYRLPSEDYGSRIDVLYLNKKIQLDHDWENVLNSNGHLKSCTSDLIMNLLDSLKKQHPDLKLIQLNSQSKLNQPLSPDNFTYDVQYSFMPIIEHFFKEYEFSKTHPLLGTQVIMEILSCQPKTVKLFGFDFYYRLKENNYNCHNLTHADFYPKQYYHYEKLHSQIIESHKDTLNIDIYIISNIILAIARNRNSGFNKNNTHILYTNEIKTILQNFIRKNLFK